MTRPAKARKQSLKRCACGCGKRFPATKASRLYATTTCKNRVTQARYRDRARADRVLLTKMIEMEQESALGR